jgi:O-antigen biosynthesis protein
MTTTPSRLRVAVCEAGPLEPERDAGSRAVADMIETLGSLGHETRFLSEVDGDLVDAVTRFAPDVVLVSRPGLFARVASPLRALGVPLVYLAHDLHFVRLDLGARLGAGPDAGAARVMRLVEQHCFGAADLVLLPTDDEVRRAAVEFPGARCQSVPYFVMPSTTPPTGAPDRLELVFVGGSRHAPNPDGVGWFLEQVWPGARRDHPGARLRVFGDWPADTAIAAVPGVEVHRGLPDAELDAAMRGATAGIAPLRFGAGMKRKTLHYLSLGLPVIGTGFSVEGLADDAGRVPGVVTAEDPRGWADALAALADAEDWRALSRAGREFVERRFSRSAQATALSDALGQLR